MSQLPNGLRYPRWGGRRDAVRLGKMLRRRKRLGIAPESPASGARFVGRGRTQDTLIGKKQFFVFMYPRNVKPVNGNELFVKYTHLESKSALAHLG
jgi:hypothetical protein